MWKEKKATHQNELSQKGGGKNYILRAIYIAIANYTSSFVTWDSGFNKGALDAIGCYLYENIDKNNIYLDSILDLNALEFLKDLDEIIGDSDIDLEEVPDNSKIIQEEFNEDWDPNLAVEAYL